MAKIVIIGAGSHQFARRLISDILWFPQLRDSLITLVDIDQERLNLITVFAHKLVEQHGFKTQIESTTNRREALKGADYVIVTIAVEGETRAVQDISLKYGIEGGWTGPDLAFAGLRQIPVILDICHDMEKLCPDAWFLEYSNPVPLICWAINDYTKVKNVGLCHSVQSTSNELARYLGIPFKELEVPKGAVFNHFGYREQEEFKEISHWVAGINHMAWFLEFKWRGKDAYPLLRERFKDPVVYSGPHAHWDGPDIVRAEIFKSFGYFCTENSQMVATLTPYFYKKNRPELFEKFKLESMKKKLRGFEKSRREQDEEFKQQLNSDIKFPIVRSVEYGAAIIHSIETDTPLRINGNVKNKGLITNLLEGCCVEIPCLADKHGITPCYVGDLPSQLAALNCLSINAQELMVEGIVEKDKTKIFQASLLDPLIGTILTIDETSMMIDELFQAEESYLKDFK